MTTSNVIGKIRAGAAIVLGVLVVVAILQNASAAEVRFLWFQFSMSLALLLLITAVIGVLIGMLTAFILRRRHRR